MAVAQTQPIEPQTVLLRAAQMDDIYPVLQLHSEAFADKFGAAFGSRARTRGVEALAEAWRRQGTSALRGMLVAVADGEIVGTTTLRTWEMGGDDAAAAEWAFQHVLGVWGALRSMFALSLLDHQINRDEGYITDVAVRGDYRRRGIAQMLLARAEDEARARRKRYLSLYVSASNRGARQLYYTNGFRDIRIRRSVTSALVLHRWAWVFMRKAVEIAS